MITNCVVQSILFLVNYIIFQNIISYSYRTKIDEDINKAVKSLCTDNILIVLFVYISCIGYVVYWIQIQFCKQLSKLLGDRFYRLFVAVHLVVSAIMVMCFILVCNKYNNPIVSYLMYCVIYGYTNPNISDCSSDINKVKIDLTDEMKQIVKNLISNSNLYNMQLPNYNISFGDIIEQVQDIKEKGICEIMWNRVRALGVSIMKPFCEFFSQILGMISNNGISVLLAWIMYSLFILFVGNFDVNYSDLENYLFGNFSLEKIMQDTGKQFFVTFISVLIIKIIQLIIEVILMRRDDFCLIYLKLYSIGLSHENKLLRRVSNSYFKPESKYTDTKQDEGVNNQEEESSIEFNLQPLQINSDDSSYSLDRLVNDINISIETSLMVFEPLNYDTSKSLIELNDRIVQLHQDLTQYIRKAINSSVLSEDISEQIDVLLNELKVHDGSDNSLYEQYKNNITHMKNEINNLLQQVERGK